MANDNNRFDNIDVICEMKSDGVIVPLRLRFPDEDGEFHVYTIKGFKRLNNDTLFHLPDSGYQHSNFVVFVCRIIVFAKPTEVLLYYDRNLSHWWMCTHRN